MKSSAVKITKFASVFIFVDWLLLHFGATYLKKRIETDMHLEHPRDYESNKYIYWCCVHVGP